MRWRVSKQRSEIERLGEILGFRFKPREDRSDERKELEKRERVLVYPFDVLSLLLLLASVHCLLDA